MEGGDQPTTSTTTTATTGTVSVAARKRLLVERLSSNKIHAQVPSVIPRRGLTRRHHSEADLTTSVLDGSSDSSDSEDSIYQDESSHSATAGAYDNAFRLPSAVALMAAKFDSSCCNQSVSSQHTFQSWKPGKASLLLQDKQDEDSWSDSSTVDSETNELVLTRLANLNRQPSTICIPQVVTTTTATSSTCSTSSHEQTETAASTIVKFLRQATAVLRAFKEKERYWQQRKRDVELHHHQQLKDIQEMLVISKQQLALETTTTDDDDNDSIQENSKWVEQYKNELQGAQLEHQHLQAQIQQLTHQNTLLTAKLQDPVQHDERLELQATIDRLQSHNQQWQDIQTKQLNYHTTLKRKVQLYKQTKLDRKAQRKRCESYIDRVIKMVQMACPQQTQLIQQIKQLKRDNSKLYKDKTSRKKKKKDNLRDQFRKKPRSKSVGSLKIARDTARKEFAKPQRSNSASSLHKMMAQQQRDNNRQNDKSKSSSTSKDKKDTTTTLKSSSPTSATSKEELRHFHTDIESASDRASDHQNKPVVSKSKSINNANDDGVVVKGRDQASSANPNAENAADREQELNNCQSGNSILKGKPLTKETATKAKRSSSRSRPSSSSSRTDGRTCVKEGETFKDDDSNRTSQSRSKRKNSNSSLSSIRVTETKLVATYGWSMRVAPETTNKDKKKMKKASKKSRKQSRRELMKRSQSAPGLLTL